MTKATIHDVASTAGVSVATVDRVLNDRGGVREETREKVRAAMQQLNYRPNTFAARLSKSRIYHFLFILPAGRNPFMDRLYTEIEAAAEPAKGEGVFIETQFVEAFDGNAISGFLEGLPPDRWDGVAVVVPDLPLVRQAVDACVAGGIRVVTLVSDLPASTRSYYVGIDNIAAGRVAGRLLGRFTCGRPGKLAIIPGSLTLGDHMERFMGCGQIVRGEFPHLDMLPPVEGRDNAEDTKAVVEALLREHGDGVVAIYNIGAGNRGLITALQKSRRRGEIAVVAHELSPHSRKALLDGTFAAVLDQNPRFEVERAVTLLRQLCDGEREIANAFVHADIFLPDNLP